MMQCAIQRTAGRGLTQMHSSITLRRCFATEPTSSNAATPAPTAATAPASSTCSIPHLPIKKTPRKQGKAVMIGLGAFIALGFSFPFWLHWHNQQSGNHYTASKALTPAQVMRGAYMNTGSKDIGPDPTWHAKHGITPIEGAAIDQQRTNAK